MMLLLGVLLNSLWEGAVIAFVAWFVLRIARNANATTRYLVWTCALVATVVLPVATALAVDVTHATRVVKPPVVSSQSSVDVAPAIPRHTRLVPQPTHTAESTPLPPVPRRLEIRLPQNVVWGAIGLWAAIALFQLVRFAFALSALERLKRNATPLPIEYRDQLHRWNSNEHVHGGVRLCISDEILVPVAVGLFDSMILIPQSLLQRLQPDDVDRILLHEFAHLRRRDDWIHAFQRAVGAVLFFNPAVAFIANHMDLEREVSCDDSVLERDGLQPVPYATCLTKMAEIVAWPYAPLAAPGVFNTRRNLSIRVERLLTSARDKRTRVAAIPALAAMVLIAGAGIAGASVSPAFAFALPAVEAKAAAILPHVSHKIAAKHAAPTLKHIEQHTVVHAEQHQKVALVAAAPAPTAQPSAKPARVRAVVKAKAPAKVKVKVKAAATSAPHLTTSQDPDYIQELANLGYTGLSIDELVELKGVGVDGQYIRQIESAGFNHPTTRQLMELRGVGVTPDYIAQMRTRFSNLSVRDLVELRGVGVTPDYIAQMSARYGNLSLRDVEELRGVGVTPEYIDELARAGYPNLSRQQIVEARGVGIDAAYIRKVAEHGFHNLEFRKLVEMKAVGLP
jgi:beta-lactamase regulating signal transducer with metallopeptidase domain